MKTITDIEEEYKNFDSKTTTVTNLEELNAYMEIIFGEIAENIRALKVDYDGNKKCKLLASIRNLFPMFFEEEEVGFYDEDNKCLDEILLLNLIYENYFKTILVNSNESNLREMIKLVDFLVLHYGKDIDYVESKRDNLEYRLKGYGCINCRDEDTYEAVSEFFSKKIKEFEVEKVKKM